MLILDYPEWRQPTVAQILIPEAAYKLAPELEKTDKLLQDESYENSVYGEEVIEEINRNLLKSLVQKKLLKGQRTRIDSTVVEANIAHPTDAGLLYEGVRKLTKAVARIKQACGKASRQSTTSIRKMKDYLLSINKVLRRRTEDARTEVREITGHMAMEARKAVTRAYRLAKKLIPETKNDLKLRGDLLDTIQKVQKIIEQSEAVNDGDTKPADRLISFKDPDARPKVRVKLGKRVEFGYKLQIQETESCIITGYKLYKGNPSDKVLVEDALRNYMELLDKAPTEMSV